MQVKSFAKKNQKNVKESTLKNYGCDHILKVPEFKKKSLEACRELPTEPEKVLITILSPLGFEYTGDCSKTIKTLNGVRFPDFIRESDKKIVECFGNHFHKSEEENSKISDYKDVGYSCLVIWASELNDLNKVKERIFSFLEPVENIRQTVKTDDMFQTATINKIAEIDRNVNPLTVIS
jgi:G:T-mismatch repair DNA endonuclease (very short patch repair protein)